MHYRVYFKELPSEAANSAITSVRGNKIKIGKDWVLLTKPSGKHVFQIPTHNVALIEEEE